jgi:hypothetical protein
LHLPRQDYAVFGSGPLLVRDLIPASNDIDVLCRGGAWEQVNTIGEVKHLPEYDVEYKTIARRPKDLDHLRALQNAGFETDDPSLYQSKHR